MVYTPLLFQNHNPKLQNVEVCCIAAVQHKHSTAEALSGLSANKVHHSCTVQGNKR
jgi:hypothetical protein